MNPQYTAFARVYDKLNAADYDAWVRCLHSLLLNHSLDGFEVKTILDLACGTGRITAGLSALGYEMTGLDLSEDMLTEADARLNAGGHRVLLTRQDMRDFSLASPVDACVCCFDSINYLTKPSDVADCFARVYEALNSGGLFIFDVNTLLKYETVYALHDFIPEAEDGTLCAWRSDYNPNTRLCRFHLSIFEPCGDTGLWTRSDEVQKERAYTDRQLNGMLKPAGFEILAAYGELGAPPAPDDLRRIRVCRKPA
ncbi:MAG: class I SAM-dependent methyltransferase [Clostridiales bacterium]|nr:class I SAM-dependent methyltransferase [Clostridiales bacterium]